MKHHIYAIQLKNINLRYSLFIKHFIEYSGEIQYFFKNKFYIFVTTIYKTNFTTKKFIFVTHIYINIYKFI